MQLIQTFKENSAKIIFVAILELSILLQGVYCYVAFSASKSVLLVAGIAVILVAALAWLLFVKAKRENHFIQRVFLGAFLVAGCFYLIIFPPNSVPDEIFHFQASYKYSDMMLGEDVSNSEITIRNEDKVLFDDRRTSVSLTHCNDVLGNVSLFATQDGSAAVAVQSSFSIVDNPPQTKLASAFGITLGKVLGLGAYPLYYLGRLFNLILLAVLVYFSVKITPVGKNVFMAVALLPMTLHLAASYSYDPAIIGMSFLLTALCLKAIYETGNIEKKLLVGIGVLVFLIVPCKVIYACTAFLVLLIPKERFASRKVCIAIKAGMVLIGIFALLLFKLPSLISLAGVPAVGASTVPSVEQFDVRGNETGHFYTLSDVLADPIGVLLLYVVSFGDIGYWYVESAIGQSLGWFQDDIIASDLVSIAFVIILLVASLKSSDDDRVISGILRMTLIAIVLVVWLLASASMLLGHTFVGDPHIMGVQGRYILPVLPLLLIALQNSKVVYQGNPVKAVVLSAFALNLLYMDFVFAKALMI